MRDEPQLHLTEVSPSCWTVTFSRTSINLIDVGTIGQLAALVDRT
jgi:hypothetical protein